MPVLTALTSKMMIPGQKPESPIVYAQSADTFVTSLVTKKNKANDNNNKYPKVQERLLQPDIHIGFCKHLFGVCELLSPITYTHAYLIPQPCHSQTCWFFLPWPFSPLPWEFSWPLCISSSWVSIFLVSFVLNKYFSTHKTHGQSPWTYQSDLIWPLISLSSWHMLCSPDITSHVWKLEKLGWA